MSFFAVLSLDQSDGPTSHPVSLFCQEKFVVQLVTKGVFYSDTTQHANTFLIPKTSDTIQCNVLSTNE